MIVCHGLMLYIILRLFGQCLYDTVKNTPEEDKDVDSVGSWNNLSRLEQAMKLYHIKCQYFSGNRTFMMSPALYKFCSKKSREPNKIRFGPQNKPKAHQSWVMLRNNNDDEGTVYNLPMTYNQFETIMDAAL
jgi:hypothetical protein